MGRLSPWLLIALASCADTGNHPDTTDATSNDPRCPADHPAFAAPGTESECVPDLTCRWPARGCAPGAKPDNECTCGPAGWQCTDHVRNCLPLGEPYPQTQLSDGLRPAPRHRATADPCSNPATAPRDATCASRSGGRGDCSSHGDCDPAEVCLDAHEFGGMSACTCTASACSTDADCDTDELCQCGTIDAQTRCGGWSRIGCGHQCIQATCRTDSDCGDGFCSPSFEDCGWYVVRWVCHDPQKDECLSDAECAYVEGGRRLCQHSPGGWRCVSRPLCD